MAKKDRVKDESDISLLTDVVDSCWHVRLLPQKSVRYLILLPISVVAGIIIPKVRDNDPSVTTSRVTRRGGDRDS